MQLGNFDHLVKILMIGDSGVGKTCILQRFEKGDFRMNHLPTIAIDFSIKSIHVKGKTLKMQIWDTAGQERYNTLTAGFFKSTHSVLLCFSLTDRSSFDSVHKWMNQINSLAPKEVLIILIGNKADLVDERKVTDEEARRLAHEFNIHYFESSAATGQNIEEAFNFAGEKLIEQIDKTSFEGNGNKLEAGSKIPKPSCCK